MKRFGVFVCFLLVAAGWNVADAQAYDVKACRAQFAEMYTTPCPLGTSVDITSVTLGVSQDVVDTCIDDTTDCRQDLSALDSTLFDEILSLCENRIICDPVVAPVVSMECNGNTVLADYMIIEYTCKANDVFLKHSLTCATDEITDISCELNYEISIIQSLFVYSVEGACVEGVREFACVTNMTQVDFALYDSVQSACAGNTQCDNGGSGLVATITQNMQCLGDSDHVLFIYECKPETKIIQRCINGAFDGNLCDEDYVIAIQTAQYGDENRDLSADECLTLTDTTTCLIDLAVDYINYYQQILDLCEGNRDCGNLRANKGPVGVCFDNRRPSYLRITFYCIIDIAVISTTTTTTTTTTPPTTTSPTTIPNTSDPIITTPSTTTPSTTTGPSSTSPSSTTTTSPSSTDLSTITTTSPSSTSPSSTSPGTTPSSTIPGSSTSSTSGTTPSTTTTSAGSTTTNTGSTTTTTTTTSPGSTTTSSPGSTTTTSPAAPTAPTTTTTTGGGGGIMGGTNMLIILVSVIGGSIFLITIIVLCVWCAKRRRRLMQKPSFYTNSYVW